MTFREVLTTTKPIPILLGIMDRIHSNGPVELADLETLAYLKRFHEDAFLKQEKKLMYLLGLFYKMSPPEDLLSLSYSIFSQAIFHEFEKKLTPVQASIQTKILHSKYFSFSAPTSTGKSHIFRELIYDEEGDIIIVVPSRALIAEYVLAIKKILINRKDILVLQFIDDINKSKTSRRVFVVTPERASEIFKMADRFNPSLFLYDEAQISEEVVRGISFDAFVRRADKVFPDAKKVFAHPFVQNPEAQLIKHDFDEQADSHLYRQNTVGKIYLEYVRRNHAFNYFSPFIEGGHKKKNKEACELDLIAELLLANGSVLIYVSKQSIYNKSFEQDFSRYIDLCEPVTDKAALEMIEEIKDLIGAESRKSNLVALMKRGIVVHHGSIPLNVRFVIEKFTNAGFAKMCFATSTLIQGVNMPFDAVWIENIKFTGSDEDKTLGLKNLIGRAGRTTDRENNFDYGFVVVNNPKKFTERLNKDFRLSESSQLDKEVDVSSDQKEFIDAVKENNFNNDYNLPTTRVERLASDEASSLVSAALSFLFKNGKVMTGSEYRQLTKASRLILKNALAGIYELSLNRQMYLGELAVLSASISILLWRIQGKSFKEILSLRYGFLTNQEEQRELKKSFRETGKSQMEFEEEIGKMPIKYSVIPESLPNASLKNKKVSRFGRLTIKDLNYDLVVYDTYDFLDKVISFSLANVFIAAFDQFYKRTKDERANDMAKYIQYGTNDEIEIWLMRYGYSIEEAEEIKPFVKEIDESGITFSEDVGKIKKIRELVERYL